MADFHDVQFPPVIARGATGGPGYSTTIIETVGGREKRLAAWSQSRGKWNVGSGLKRRADLATLIAFFHARRGRAYGFRFKDWSDYSGTAEPIGTGDGAATVFQLLRRYASGGVTIDRTITRPVVGTVKVYAGGVLQAPAVDHATGRVTFAAAPAAGVAITADFAFDVPARFDTDDLGLSLEHFDLGQWAEIPVWEIKE